MISAVAERGGDGASSCFSCRVFKTSIFIRLYFYLHYLNFQETLHNKLWEKCSPSCGVSHSTEGGSRAFGLQGNTRAAVGLAKGW